MQKHRNVLLNSGNIAVYTAWPEEKFSNVLQSVSFNKCSNEIGKGLLGVQKSFSSDVNGYHYTKTLKSRALTTPLFRGSSNLAAAICKREKFGFIPAKSLFRLNACYRTRKNQWLVTSFLLKNEEPSRLISFFTPYQITCKEKSFSHYRLVIMYLCIIYVLSLCFFN